jgi:uncharacterized SAM-binding protein YcdF (DUF218 family)
MLLALLAVPWLIALLLCPRRRKVLAAAGLACWYVVACGWPGEPLLHRLEGRVPAVAPHFNGRVALLMLGSGTEYDDGPPHHLVPKRDALRRIEATAALYANCTARGAACTVIVSGGNPQRHIQSEADNYRPYLVARGVPPRALVLENRSLTTYENAKYTRAILGNGHYESVILVTSAYHLPRALLDFRRFGVTVIPFASNQRALVPTLTPRWAHLVNTAVVLHEWVGIAQFHVYRRLGWF